MKRTILLLLAALLVWSLTACTPIKLKQARKGLLATMAELPENDEFIIVASHSGENYNTFEDITCYSSSGVVAIGTFIPKEEALVAYVNVLEKQGWTICDDTYNTVKSLVRGEHEWATVDSYAPSLYMEMNEDYKRAQEVYPTLLHINIQYWLPSREDCLGE